MQTQYRLLYRYVNNNTNIAITDEADYKKTEEFYTIDHKVNITAAKLSNLMTVKDGDTYELKHVYDGIPVADYANTLVNEGTSEREDLITENMANEAKSNNLYVYTGTKKVFHKEYIPDQLGYVVRDWTRVPTEQIPSGPDDYSKHFVMLGGSQLGVDNAYLVCKPQFIHVYMKKLNVSVSPAKKCFLCISTEDPGNKGYNKNYLYSYHMENYIGNLRQIIDENVFFDWIGSHNADNLDYGEVTISGGFKGGAEETGTDGLRYCVTSDVYRNGSDARVTSYYYLFWDNEKGYTDNPSNHGINMTSSVPVTRQYHTLRGFKVDATEAQGYRFKGNYIEIAKENIRKDVIPAHYEDSGKSPYIIKDQYEKVSLSPWMLHSVHNSLDSGLTAAKTLVSMIGIDNVKLVKYVPVGQFIDIK